MRRRARHSRPDALAPLFRLVGAPRLLPFGPSLPLHGCARCWRTSPQAHTRIPSPPSLPTLERPPAAAGACPPPPAERRRGRGAVFAISKQTRACARSCLLFLTRTCSVCFSSGADLCPEYVRVCVCRHWCQKKQSAHFFSRDARAPSQNSRPAPKPALALPHMHTPTTRSLSVSCPPLPRLLTGPLFGPSLLLLLLLTTDSDTRSSQPLSSPLDPASSSRRALRKRARPRPPLPSQNGGSGGEPARAARPCRGVVRSARESRS